MHSAIQARVPIPIAAALLALAFAIVAVIPQQAFATDLKATGSNVPMTLTTQSNAANNSMANAAKLSSGKDVVGTLDYSDGTTQFQSLWYSFETSHRKSAYSLTVTPLDDSDVILTPFSSDGRKAVNYDDTAAYAFQPKYMTAWIATADSKSTRLLSRTRTKSDANKNDTLYFKVDAYGAYGAVQRYDRFKITVTEHPIIGQVTGLKAAKRTKTSITMKWSRQANATKYQVKWRKKGSSWKKADVTSSSKAFKKLKQSTAYQFKVRAYCKGGWSASADKAGSWGAWSAVKTVKTKK